GSTSPFSTSSDSSAFTRSVGSDGTTWWSWSWLCSCPSWVSCAFAKSPAAAAPAAPTAAPRKTRRVVVLSILLAHHPSRAAFGHSGLRPQRCQAWLPSCHPTPKINSARVRGRSFVTSARAFFRRYVLAESGLLFFRFFGHDRNQERIAIRIRKLMTIHVRAMLDGLVHLEAIVLRRPEVFDVLQHHSPAVRARLALQLQVRLLAVRQLCFHDVAGLMDFDGPFLHLQFRPIQ